MKQNILFISLFLVLCNLYAQTDTLIFKNGNMVEGEIKSMSRGVIQIETDYSDTDFLIEWEKVTELYSQQKYMISLDNGERTKSKINTDPSDKSKLIMDWDGTELKVDNNDVVYIKPLEDRFIDRLNASIDLGVSVAKANNLRQLTTRSYLGYFTDNWSADASLDAVRSSQDSIANTERTDASVSFNYFLGKNWFALVSAKFLQNDEQKLELRATPKTGIGNYIIQTNEMYLSLYAGAAWNNETYTDPTIPNRSDAEANFGTELNLFDMGDLGLLTGLSVYKSIKEGDRVRADFKFDIKYDLPLDFYIKLGYTLNYDSQPVEGASENDYVIQTTFGWEL
jgi:putative salt-induced outer membrane protein YdiY